MLMLYTRKRVRVVHVCVWLWLYVCVVLTCVLICCHVMCSLVQRYEGLTNKIIAQIGDKQMKNTATEGANGVQKLATCFRCAEVGK